MENKLASLFVVTLGMAFSRISLSLSGRHTVCPETLKRARFSTLIAFAW